MRTMFFDLATTTGWAFGDQKMIPKAGRFTIRDKHDVFAFLLEGEEYLRSLMQKARVEQVGYEAPVLNPRRDNPWKLRKLYGLANLVPRIAYDMRIPCRECTIGEIRTHFLGKGYPRDSERVKIRTKVKCRSLGWIIRDDNEADALAGLDYMLSIDRPERAVMSTPLFQSKASRKRAEGIT